MDHVLLKRQNGFIHGLPDALRTMTFPRPTHQIADVAGCLALQQKSARLFPRSYHGATAWHWEARAAWMDPSCVSSGYPTDSLFKPWRNPPTMRRWHDGF